MRQALALTFVVALAGCDGGPPDVSVAGASADASGKAVTRGAFTAAAGSDAGASASSSPARAAAPITLTLLGEIELPDGGVQRSYRAVLRPGTAAPAGLRAELVDAGAGRHVAQGRVRFEASAGDRLLQIAQRDTSPLDPAALRWVLTPVDVLQDTQGALLPGAPDTPAAGALRDYRWSGLPAASGARLAAVLRADAQVDDVNRALRETGLRIAAMRPGNHTLELRSPNGAGEAVLQPVAQRLQASPAFEWVRVQPAAPAPVTAAWQLPQSPDPHACQD